MPAASEAEAAVEAVFREEWGRITASLIAMTGDWDLAEECAQDAFTRALSAWDRDGVPERRTRWDRDAVDEGLRLLAAAADGEQPGPYLLQAEIAACHAGAARPEDTDWAAIARLYAQLALLLPSPVVELNRAVAVGMADGPAAGLAIADDLAARGALPRSRTGDHVTTRWQDHRAP